MQVQMGPRSENNHADYLLT